MQVIEISWKGEGLHDPAWHDHTPGPFTIRDTQFGLVAEEASDEVVANFWCSDTDITDPDVITSNATLLVAAADPETGLKASHAAIARLEDELMRMTAERDRSSVALTLACETIKRWSASAGDISLLVNMYLTDADEDMATAPAIDGDALQAVACEGKGD